MWLLDTTTYRMSRFPDRNRPLYVTLSHMWEKQEVSFRDMYEAGMVVDESDPMTESTQSGSFAQKYPLLAELRAYNQEKLFSKKGWTKITNFCDEARAHKMSHAWIDTCCIDKSSSAELQEAINSMYEWYNQGEKCFVYLNDVHGQESDLTFKSEFVSSRWFTRGWTLQELLAPLEGTISFFNSQWQCVGTDTALAQELADASRIPLEVIKGYESGREKDRIGKSGKIGLCPVAQKLSWASLRKTTRGEDRTYSLLGIFGITMPLLYGEGEMKAFLRLQHKIVKTINDETIFVWKRALKNYHGLFATDVSNFKDSHSVSSKLIVASTRLYTRTSRGLQMDLWLRKLTKEEQSELDIAWPNGYRVAPLQCCMRDERHGYVYLLLKGIDDTWQRVGDYFQARFELMSNSQGWEKRTIFVT